AYSALDHPEWDGTLGPCSVDTHRRGQERGSTLLPGYCAGTFSAPSPSLRPSVDRFTVQDYGTQQRMLYKILLMPQPPTLYERQGGVYSIATVIDDFIDRIMVDPRLNANPRVDEAHHRVPPAGFKYLATEMVCWAAGGPQKYTGRSMYESHKDMKITG